jgi:hypothetical protein
MTSKDAVTPLIGVLDVDGLHLPDRPLVPITGAIRHVGDLYNGARRHRLTQLWLTDAWVRAAGLPDALAGTGQFRELRHAFVSDGLDDLHAFPTALTPWLDLRKKVASALAAALGIGERPAPATLQLKADSVFVSIRGRDLFDITQALDGLPAQLARLDLRRGERRLVYTEGAWHIDP